MKKTTLLLLLVLSSIAGFGQSDRAKNWSADIDFLIGKIKKEHYVYKNQSLPAAFYQQVDTLKKYIPGYTDERMLIELGRLMYYLGDGHSYILPFGFKLTGAHFLPLHLYEFSDGMYVTNTDSVHLHLVGMRIKKIGKHTPEKIMNDMVSFISQDNTMGAKWLGPFFLRFRGMLESYGLENNSAGINIEFEDSKGRSFEEKVNFIPVPQLRGVPKLSAPGNTGVTAAPLYLSNVSTNFWMRSIPKKKTLYFQFNQVRDADNETLAEFSKRLEKELINTKPTLLIVDVRHNNGGNGDLTPPLIAVLKKYEQVQKGKIVVITGRNTFSAAQIFITKVDKETNAEFAGEPSSSSPNFVGEENPVILPYSGAMGSISNRYHENNKGDNRKWIEPGLRVVLSSKDYFGNVDPVMEGVWRRYARKD